MDKYILPEKIRERFELLPEIMQDIILESGWEKTTRRIVEDLNLRIDQGVAIENEIMLVMFGFEDPVKFSENINQISDIDSEIASKIIFEVNTRIFSLFKEKIMDSTDSENAYFEETDSSLKEDVVETKESILAEIEKEDEIPKINNSVVSQKLDEPTVTESPKKESYKDPYKEPID